MCCGTTTRCPRTNWKHSSISCATHTRDVRVLCQFQHLFTTRILLFSVLDTTALIENLKEPGRSGSSALFRGFQAHKRSLLL
uniref:Uncharacterized protein n=1 Tax=Parascaris univalens TaxID=6257 RepID=A0A915A3B9_PARUN